MLPPVLSNRASDVMALEERQRGHGATQPQTFPSAWDLTLCPGKLLPGLASVVYRRESHFLPRPWFLDWLFGRPQSSNPAVCCNLRIGPSISSRCWTLNRRVRGSRRRYLHQQLAVHLRSSSGRPRVLWFSGGNCRYEPINLGFTTLIILEDPHSYSSIRNSPTARPSSQHFPEYRSINLTQFAPQFGFIFLLLAKPPASMCSGFLHMLASLAPHWRSWRPSGTPFFLRHRFPWI